MKEHALLERTVVVKAFRKSKGTIADGRKGNTGKKGVIYGTDAEGKRVELAVCRGATFRDLSRKLFETGLVPRHVTIKSKGETRF
ncbi:MAG TPA: hypothetical protein VLB83_05460 [Candidatus Paceibacterota bacterium]|nr:hypothetical protein [Candidatus Paceibacterota bacterium]